jgi:hypothetical protein
LSEIRLGRGLPAREGAAKMAATQACNWCGTYYL